jgi:hypothetical protein
MIASLLNIFIAVPPSFGPVSPPECGQGPHAILAQSGLPKQRNNFAPDSIACAIAL